MKTGLLLMVLAITIHASAQLAISRSNAIADIDFYNATLEAVHYNPYMHISRDNYVRKTDSIKKTIQDSIDIRSFILKLYSLSALLEDGHASPAIPALLRGELVKKQFLPFAVAADDEGELYVVEDGSGKQRIPAGARILSINNVDSKGFFKNATTNMGGLPHFKIEVASRLFAYFLFLHKITAPFTITYFDDVNEVKKLVIDEGMDLRSAFSLALPNLNAPPYSFKLLDQNLGYIDFVSMTGSYQAFDRFLDSCFAVMRRNDIQNLAIDLRKNSGGNSMLGEVLLSYITRKPLSQAGGRVWKVSQQYKNYLLSSGDSANPYLKQPTGSLWKLGGCGPKKQRFQADTVFAGKVYFITGALTYSSANMLADAVKHYKLATIVGEPTGESTNDFGEVYTAQLPASKITMQLTTSYDLGVGCKKNHKLPVIPDKLVRTTVLHRSLHEDPALHFILKTIR